MEIQMMLIFQMTNHGGHDVQCNVFSGNFGGLKGTAQHMLLFAFLAVSYRVKIDSTLMFTQQLVM